MVTSAVFADLNGDGRPDLLMLGMDSTVAARLDALGLERPEDQTALAREAARSVKPDDTSYQAWMLKGNTIPRREWLDWNEQRHQLRLKWDAFFQDYDLLLCPAGATAAFPHNQKGERWERTIQVNGHRVPTTDQMFWAGYSGGPCS